mgnify:CR=1 FL=1
MNLQSDRNMAAENCMEYESAIPLITAFSSMALGCCTCVKYQNGSCSMALADKINHIISIN